MFTGRLLCYSLDLQGRRVRDTEQHLGLVPECAESSLLSDSLGLERSSDLADLSGHARAGDDGAGAALGHLRAGEDEAYSVSAYVSGSSRAWSGSRFGSGQVMCEREDGCLISPRNAQDVKSLGARLGGVRTYPTGQSSSSMGSDCLATGRLSPARQRGEIVGETLRTGEERLVAFQVGAVAIDNSSVRRNDVSVSQQDGVSRDDVLDGDDLCLRLFGALGMSDDGCLGRTDRFERCDGLRFSADLVAGEISVGKIPDTEWAGGDVSELRIPHFIFSRRNRSSPFQLAIRCMCRLRR